MSDLGLIEAVCILGFLSVLIGVWFLGNAYLEQYWRACKAAEEPKTGRRIEGLFCTACGLNHIGVEEQCPDKSHTDDCECPGCVASNDTIDLYADLPCTCADCIASRMNNGCKCRECVAYRKIKPHDRTVCSCAECVAFRLNLIAEKSDE